MESSFQITNGIVPGSVIDNNKNNEKKKPSCCVFSLRRSFYSLLPLRLPNLVVPKCRDHFRICNSHACVSLCKQSGAIADCTTLHHRVLCRHACHVDCVVCRVNFFYSQQRMRRSLHGDSPLHKCAVPASPHANHPNTLPIRRGGRRGALHSAGEGLLRRFAANAAD